MAQWFAKECNMWNCKAIDHGITVFPSGQIGPCCQIDIKYLKPASEVHNPDRFADLKTVQPPSACSKCTYAEEVGMWSYRSLFETNYQPNKDGVQFLDIRNTNLCNLKCRYCSSLFSDKWAAELGHSEPLVQSPIDDMRMFVTDSLHDVYFTGGEPLLSADHWEFLQYIIDHGKPEQISLRYNTNVTTAKYKDLDIADLWNRFAHVQIACSVDAIGELNNYIRSGSKWEAIEANLEKFIALPNVTVSLSPVISILNIWHLHELYRYAREKNIRVGGIVLYGPDVLSLSVCPDSLKEEALAAIEKIKEYNDSNDAQVVDELVNLVTNNHNKESFVHTISHILSLDAMRNERLYNYLPFADAIKDRILIYNDYTK